MINKKTVDILLRTKSDKTSLNVTNSILNRQYLSHNNTDTEIYIQKAMIESWHEQFVEVDTLWHVSVRNLSSNDELVWTEDSIIEMVYVIN